MHTFFPYNLQKRYNFPLRRLNMALKYQEAGNCKNKTIVLIHGAGGSSATWFMQLKGLSKRFHIVAMDLNGHGGSQDRSEEDIQSAYLEDIEQFVTQYNDPILGGHSMGGALTQLYALRYPEQLSGIILIGTGARLRVNPMIFELLDNDFEGYIEALGTYMFHDGSPMELIETSKHEAKKCSPRVIRRDFEFCNAFDIMQDVASIQIPTLVIVGAEDVMTPIKYADYLHQKIGESHLQVVKNAGHMAMLEQASVVNSIIANWVVSLA